MTRAKLVVAGRSLAAHGWERPADVIAAVEDQRALQADPSLLRTPTRRTDDEAVPAPERLEDAGKPYIIPKPDAVLPPGAVPPPGAPPTE